VLYSCTAVPGDGHSRSASFWLAQCAFLATYRFANTEVELAAYNAEPDTSFTKPEIIPAFADGATGAAP